MSTNPSRSVHASSRALLLLALALSACSADGTGAAGDRFRLAGSYADDLLPGTGRGAMMCNEFHRNLSGRTPAQQQAELTRLRGTQIELDRAVRHSRALEQLCPLAPSAG